MPPKSKKKKSKTSKSRSKEAARHQPKGVHDLEQQLFQLSHEWETSSQRKALIQQIQEEISTQKGIFLDKARFKPVGKGNQRNRGLYQLLVLETVITCLRGKFAIDSIIFQDPNFTKRDQDFLESRGHIVMEWNGMGLSTNTLDPQLIKFVSPSTFCYLPCLDLPIVVSVIHAANPCLYLGNDLIGTTVAQNLLRNKRVKSLMDEYESIVLSYEFSLVAAFTGDGITEDFGFMWKAELENEDVRERVTARNNMILEKERTRWSMMDELRKSQN